MSKLSIYEVKKVKGSKPPKWGVYRPNDEIVNGAMMSGEKEADDCLSRLVAMKYCKRKD